MENVAEKPRLVDHAKPFRATRKLQWVLETSTNGMYSAMNSQLPFHYPKSGAATGNSNLYLSNNSHHDYTYQAHQINGVGSAINSPVSLSNSHYNSSNNSTQTNVSQSPYDPKLLTWLAIRACTDSPRTCLALRIEQFLLIQCTLLFNQTCKRT